MIKNLGELREALKDFSDDTPVTYVFDKNIPIFYYKIGRVKKLDAYVQLCFNEKEQAND